MGPGSCLQGWTVPHTLRTTVGGIFHQSTLNCRERSEHTHSQCVLEPQPRSLPHPQQALGLTPVPCNQVPLSELAPEPRFCHLSPEESDIRVFTWSLRGRPGRPRCAWHQKKRIRHNLYPRGTHGLMWDMWRWFSRSVLSNSCNPIDYSPPGSSVREILQARILEWVAISISRVSS